MYVIIWEYQVKADRSAEFETIYGENGAWVELFKNGSGYLGTELLHDSRQLSHYLTIDRWASAVDYEKFLSQRRKEYDELEAQCEGLTEQETLLGKWETILHETR
jgi:heme-degrading monooxygenase HmoA